MTTMWCLYPNIVVSVETSKETKLSPKETAQEGHDMATPAILQESNEIWSDKAHKDCF